MVPGAGADKRVFLHIGVPKSGTSFVQATLRSNKQRLRRQGFLYPSRHRGDMFHAALDVNGNHEAWRLSRDDVAGAWARMCRRAMAFDGTIVISSEFFCAARPPQIREALAHLAGAEVHVIVTGRDLARQIPAEWQEGIKHGRTLTFAQFQKRIMNPKRPHPHARRFWHYQDLPGVLDRWASVVSDERVHLVTCPPSGADPSLLWERFCSVIGLDPTTTVLPAAGSNTSLGITEIEVLRQVNLSNRRTADPRMYIRPSKQVLVGDVLRNHRSPRATIPPQLLPALQDITQQWREELDRHSYHIVGDPQDLEPVATDSPWADPDEVPAEEALKVASSAITHLLGDVHRLRGEARRLRADNERLRRSRPGALLRRGVSRARRTLRSRGVLSR